MEHPRVFLHELVEYHFHHPLKQPLQEVAEFPLQKYREIAHYSNHTKSVDAKTHTRRLITTKHSDERKTFMSVYVPQN